MKKIVGVFDGKHYSTGTFEFIRLMNEEQKILATGAFLPGIDYSELLYSVGGLSGPIYYQEVELEDTELVKVNIELFKTQCVQHNIENRVHPDFALHVVEEVKKESRFADAMVLSSELFYENLGKIAQEDYTQQVLHTAECPVIMVPENYKHPQSIILSYDGSPSSVYAIKQFAYLMGAYTKLNTLLVYASDDNDDIPDLSYIEELAARHFSNLTILKLDADPKNYFQTWLTENDNPMLVCGAYGRTSLSEIFKKSFVSDIIAEHKIPVFIAHK